METYVENKWGFLKNIININTFFSNADDANNVGSGKSNDANKASADRFKERTSKIKKVD